MGRGADRLDAKTHTCASLHTHTLTRSTLAYTHLGSCVHHVSLQGTIRLMLSEQTPDQCAETPSLKAKNLQTALSSANISLVLVAMKPGMDVNDDLIAKMHTCIGLVVLCE